MRGLGSEGNPAFRHKKAGTRNWVAGWQRDFFFWDYLIIVSFDLNKFRGSVNWHELSFHLFQDKRKKSCINRFVVNVQRNRIGKVEPLVWNAFFIEH